MARLSSRSFRTLVGISALALVAGGAKVIAQEGEPAGQNPLMMDLPSAIAETEGCLGVELAQTMSGKNVIFAWFENKKAAERWYWSETHTNAMTFAGVTPGAHKVMANVPDEGPIMVIASFAPGDGEDGGFGDLGVSEISIELYQPLPGGAFAGGRFAPEGMKVEGMREYSE